MKKTILITITLAFALIANSQNLLYTTTEIINMTTVDGLVDARFRDTLYNNINNIRSGNKVKTQCNRKFTKAQTDSALINGTCTLDTNAVKFINLIFSGDYNKKAEAVLRLKHEHELIYANIQDSVCWGYTVNGSRKTGSIVHGTLIARNTTLGTYYLLIKGSSYCHQVDMYSVVRMTPAEKKAYGY